MPGGPTWPRPGTAGEAATTVTITQCRASTITAGIITMAAITTGTAATAGITTGGAGIIDPAWVILSYAA